MRQGFSRGGAALGANRGAQARQPVPPSARRNGTRNTRQPETRATHLHGENTGAVWIEPTIRFVVEVGFGSRPADATIQWTDVSSYVRSIEINRGRQDEFGTFQPGTATFLLSNLDNRFSAYYRKVVLNDGTVKPLVPIRVRVLEGGTYWHRFSGFVSGWPNRSVLQSRDANVTINAVDAFGVLARRTLSESGIAAEIRAEKPIAFWPLQESQSGLYTDDAGRFDLHLPASPTGSSANPLRYPIGANNGVAFRTQPNLTKTHADRVPRALALEGWVSAAAATYTTTSELLVGTSNYAYVDLQVVAGLSRLTFNYTNQPNGSTYGFTYLSDSATYGTTGTVTVASDTTSAARLFHFVVTVGSSATRLYINGALVSTTVPTASSGYAFTPQFSIFSSYYDTGRLTSESYLGNVAIHETDLSSLRRDKDGNRTIPAYLSHYLAGVTAFGPDWGEKGGTRIHRILDDAGWPDALRNIGTGSTVMDVYDPASSDALSKLQEVETAEQGHLFVASDGRVTFYGREWRWANNTPTVTFGDVASSIPIDDADLDWSADNIRTSCTVTWADGTQKYIDRDTTATYGELSESVAATLLPTVWQAQQLARYRVRTHDETTTLNTTPVRFTRLGVNVRAVSSTLRTTKFYGLDLGQSITLQWTPNGSPTTQITANGVLLGITETITPDEWTAELYVGPSDDGNTDTPYFVVGDATYGRLGTAAGNKLPY